MAAATQYTPASLTALLKDLSVNEDDEQILKHANNVLKKYKSDSPALRTKLVALIKLERYQDAIRLLESDETKGKLDDVELEHAYSLYKVGRISDAVEVANQGVAGEKRNRGLQHVKAQSVLQCSIPLNRKYLAEFFVI